MFRIAEFACVLMTAAVALSQTTQPALSAFDACGTLVQGTDCVVFQGGGGSYYVVDTGRYHVGDAVRVVGTLDPGCNTICKDIDGCISGGVLYDPAVFPCGTSIPQFPEDLINNAASACSAASTTTLALTLGGLWFTWRRRRTV